MENEENVEKAGCIALGFSFWFPLIGIILYFVQKDKVQNASAYLYAAGAGFGLGIILNMIAAAVAN